MDKGYRSDGIIGQLKQMKIKCFYEAEAQRS